MRLIILILLSSYFIFISLYHCFRVHFARVFRAPPSNHHVNSEGLGQTRRHVTTNRMNLFYTSSYLSLPSSFFFLNFLPGKSRQGVTPLCVSATWLYNDHVIDCRLLGLRHVASRKLDRFWDQLATTRLTGFLGQSESKQRFGRFFFF